MVATHIMLAIYGAIVIGGIGIFPVTGWLALTEYRSLGFAKSVRSVYFWILVNVTVGSVAVGWICAVRAAAILMGAANLTWYWQMLLIVPFGAILLAKTGVNWAARHSSNASWARWVAICIGTLCWWIWVVFFGVSMQ